MDTDSFLKEYGGELKADWFEQDALAIIEQHLADAESKYSDSYSGDELRSIKEAYVYAEMYDRIIMNRAADPESYDAPEGGSYRNAEWQVERFERKQEKWSDRLQELTTEEEQQTRRVRSANVPLSR